jgi:hypothetical protein
MSKNTDIVLLCSLADNINTDIIVAALNESEIPTILKRRGAGELLSVSMGGSALGVDIYVAPNHIEKAQELLNEISLDEPDEDNELEADLIRAEKAKRLKGRLLVLLILGIPLLISSIIFILSFILY